MSHTRTILIKTLVRPYYRENASLLLFFFILMVSFNTLISHDPLDYHYRLILGMLTTYQVFAFVLLGWLVYARKCAGFVSEILQNPGKSYPDLISNKQKGASRGRPYWSFFSRYLLREQKALSLGIKLFNCGLLYLLVRGLGSDDYDLRMPFLFYSIGLFAHGILIHHCRELEDRRLLFYRGLPVSLVSRFAQYSLFYLLFFLPELSILVTQTPQPLHYADATRFALYGYDLLLLLNSLSFITSLTMRGYLKLIFAIFMLQYAFMLAGMLAWFTAIICIGAIFLFFGRYYFYEKRSPGLLE